MSENRYVDFIDDDKFLDCIKFLADKYIEAVSGTNLNEFLKNRIDTVKMQFDEKMFNIEESEWIGREVHRQVDKSITNHIGEFHERLLGSVAGYSRVEVGGGYDIKKDDNSLFAEIKNKHNTLTGTYRVSLFERLTRYADEYPGATIYYVRIIDSKSRNEVWKFKSEGKEYQDERIRIISVDRFYYLITGRKTAFKEVHEAIPKAIDDYLAEKSINPGTNLGLYGELYNKSQENNRSLFDEVINANYESSNYLGFNDKF